MINIESAARSISLHAIDNESPMVRLRIGLMQVSKNVIGKSCPAYEDCGRQPIDIIAGAGHSMIRLFYHVCRFFYKMPSLSGNPVCIGNPQIDLTASTRSL